MIYVDNEISELKKVITHVPNDGISRISPKKAESLLFDDIVFYPLMHEEYSIFQRILHAFIGPENVLDTTYLIAQAIEASPESRETLIQQVLDFEELPQSFYRYLEELGAHDLSKVLITGYHRTEDRILFDPIPNYMFTRDIAVTIKDHILISKAAKEARHRENLLSQFIFNHHPIFSETTNDKKLIDLNDLEAFPPSIRAEAVNAEGGDIMMFSPDHLLIGCSERTNAYAFESIKNKIFELDLIDNVVQVNIPNERSFMHIDTLFTRIDHDTISCYKPIVYDGEGSNVVVYRKSGKRKIYPSIRAFVSAEISKDINFVFSGDGLSPYQEREQWTDSCNLVALRPGVAISYDRNLKTLNAFEKAGYRIMDSEEIFRQFYSDSNFIKNITKTIITIPSAELSRARGGSHCMTCPILRTPYSK